MDDRLGFVRNALQEIASRSGWFCINKMGISMVVVVRMIVAFAAGWLVAWGMVAVFLQVVSRERVDMMGVVAVADGPENWTRQE